MTSPPLQERFAGQMGQLLGPDFPSDIGLAVSGGGDSMAMLYLAHNWSRDFGVRLWVVTVDHGLRPESAGEAAMVAEECAALGRPHATVRWHWDGAGNVQDAARRARLQLIDRWRGSLRHVLFAHTEDDQAETVLQRLARGSGVDGLAGMPVARDVVPHALGAPDLSPGSFDGLLPPGGSRDPGFRVLRPCLGMARSELRHYARVLHGRWVEDPSNEDRGYERVRLRQLLRLLSEEGITAPVLAETAVRMGRARDGLRAGLIDAVGRICGDAPPGQVLIDRDGFARLETETQLRLLTQALRYVASAEYRPRASASEGLLTQVLSGRGGTLHGAEVLVGKTQLRVVREAAAVAGVVSQPEELWDGQWHVRIDHRADLAQAEIRALTDAGWRQIADRDGRAIPYRAALGLCSVWLGDRMIACPALGFGEVVVATRYVLGQRDTGFRAFCLSH